MTDVTLAFEGAKSKILDVVSVADNDAQLRVDDNFVDILILKFGEDFEPESLSRCCDMSLKYLFGLGDILPQGHFEEKIWKLVLGPIVT